VIIGASLAACEAVTGIEISLLIAAVMFVATSPTVSSAATNTWTRLPAT
jgi:hypothetical protein